jgi:hypothetical protein
MARNWFCQCEIKNGLECAGCPCCLPLAEKRGSKPVDKKYTEKIKKNYGTIGVLQIVKGV